MGSRAWLFLFCLLLVTAPAAALCHWSVEVSPPEGIASCTGFQDGGRDSWPRMPADAEIEAAKQEYTDFRLSDSETRWRIDRVTVAKYHTCTGGRYENRVEMEVEASWWWESVTGREGEWQADRSDTFLVYNPGTDTFEFALTIHPTPYFIGFAPDAVTGFATGACASAGTGTGTSPPPGDGPPWIVIIGAGAILGAGLVLGAKKVLAGGRAAPARDRQETKEDVRYILQLSTDHLTVTTEAPAHLQVTAWKVIGTRPPAPAPEAAITLTVPAGYEGLSVRPATGTGSVEAGVTLAAPVRDSPVILTVTAAVGKSTESARVTVEIPAEYLMEFF